MSQASNPNSEAAQALREARRQYAEASIIKRYETARQVTGLTGAERVAALAVKRKVKK